MGMSVAMRGLMKHLSILPFLCACAACGQPSLSFPNVQSPVLLGPVARVGGGSVASSAPGTTFDVEIEHEAYAAKNTHHAHFDIDRKASFAALVATSANKDADVHLAKLKAGSWFMTVATAVWIDEWLEARGDARSAR